MYSTLIIVFAALAIVFLVLWLDARSRNDASERLANELRGIDDTLNRIGHKLNSVTGAVEKLNEKKLEETVGSEAIPAESLSADSVRDALIECGIPEDKIDIDDPRRIWFTIGKTHFSVNVADLPYLSFQLGFQVDDDRTDFDLMMLAADMVSSGSPIAKVYVSPQDKYYMCHATMEANSYQHLRDNIKRYITLLGETCRRFDDKYERLKQEKREEAQKAINTAILAAQSDGSGKKIPS